MSKKTVTLSNGTRVNLFPGSQFPWADHNGTLILGPPDGSLTSDGTPLEDLSWNTSEFWLIDAQDSDGNPVELRPSEYQEALEKA